MFGLDGYVPAAMGNAVRDTERSVQPVIGLVQPLALLQWTLWDAVMTLTASARRALRG